MKDVHAIAVRSETKITAEIIAAAPLLKVVGRAGVGVDNVDVDAATERGVIVMNTPSGNTIATAELTFTHLLCGARPVPQAAASMREGKWDRKAFSGIELFRKTLGVVGLGRIGGEVARRAQAFGMRVVAFDPYLAPSRAKGMQIDSVSLDELLAQSDYITVHMPLTDDTRYMIDEAALAKCRRGVRIFNCARGGIIKESALIAALKSGQVAAAGLDVYEDEPLAAASELRKLAERDPDAASRGLDGGGPGRGRRRGGRADRRRPERRASSATPSTCRPSTPRRSRSSGRTSTSGPSWGRSCSRSRRSRSPRSR